MNPGSCEIASLNCDEGYMQQEVDGELKCVNAVNIVCAAGTYLKKGESECTTCPENSYCAGSGDGGFNVSATEDQGIATCTAPLKSPRGATSLNDCGYILRVGDNPADKLYLHADKRTSPSLAVRIPNDVTNNEVWYADMTELTTPDAAKTLNDASNKKFHVMVGDKEYTVHTSILE